MELIDRYINAVGSHLPRRNRVDIEAEIRSTLEDMLEDRSQAAGRPVDDAMVMETLKAYGAPEKVAATYHGERYLIGPRLYPLFTLVLKIVLAVLTVLALVGLGIGIGAGSHSLLEALKTAGQALANYVWGAIVAFGNIVLVFAILERFLPASALKDAGGKEGEWDPAELMKEPDPDEVEFGNPVVTILFTFAAILIFNFVPQIIAITPSLNNLGTGPVDFYPILSAAFFQYYLPWLNLLWVAEILLNLVVLRLGRLTATIRWLWVAVKVLGLGIVIRIALGPSLLGLTPGALASLHMDPTGAATLINLLSQLLRLGLLAAAVVVGVGILRDLYRLVIKPTRFNPAMIKN